MHQIAILNYATCKIEIIDISAETWQKYAENLDSLIYNVWGYKRTEIYYMSGENGIAIIHLHEKELM